MAISRSQVTQEADCLIHCRLMNKRMDGMGWDRQDRHTAQLIKKEKKGNADGRREDKLKDKDICIVETELSRACGVELAHLTGCLTATSLRVRMAAKRSADFEEDKNSCSTVGSRNRQAKQLTRKTRQTIRKERNGVYEEGHE